MNQPRCNECSAGCAGPKHRAARAPRARGFTLIELIASITALSAIMVMAASLLGALSRTYNDAAGRQDTEERLSLALDRIVRTIRETPDTAGVPSIGIATSTRLMFTDTTEIVLTGDVLTLATPTQSASPLCTSVSSLTLTYLNSSGAVIDFSSGGTLAQIYAVRIALVSGESELRTVVFIRGTLEAT